jgi:hypothetical protein
MLGAIRSVAVAPLVGALALATIVDQGTSVGAASLAQAGSQAQAIDGVSKLLESVKDVGPLAKATNATDILFALASVHGGIIGALKEVRAQNREQAAVAALLKLIESTKTSKTLTEAFTCAKSAWALGELGAAAKGALPTLEELTKHDNQVVSGDATDAIKKIAG